jgi:hypothetical protein
VFNKTVCYTFLTCGRHKRTGRCCHWKTAECRCTRKHGVLRTTRGRCLPSRIVAHVIRLGGPCEVKKLGSWLYEYVTDETSWLYCGKGKKSGGSLELSRFLFPVLTSKYSKTCLNRTPYIQETWTNGKYISERSYFLCKIML